MTDPTTEDLIERLLDSDLDEPGRMELLRLIREDPALLETVRSHLEISEALSRLHSHRSDAAFTSHVRDHIVVLDAEGESEFVETLRRRIIHRKRYRYLSITGIAAALILSATLLVHHAGKDGSPRMVATLSSYTTDGSISSSGDVHAGSSHVVKDGLFRLRFTNGAVVAIEGPADFAVDSAFRVRLNSGKLNAWCPETAHGFQVVTSTGTVTDLGTSFGVSTTRGGATDFLVLEGAIEVSQAGNTRRLDKGEALRTDQSPGFKPLDFEPSPYHRTWPLASGILTTTGGVRTAPPGTAEQLSRLEDDNSVLVIPEKRNVPFDREIRAELTAPGTFSVTNAKQLHHLEPSAKMRLRSFLMRYNPEKANNFKKFEGSVTFDRPILAVCCQGTYLDATDALFANGTYADTDEEARRFRGVDLDQPPAYSDHVTLSDDLRTVTILFNAGTSTDDVRVILAED